MIYAPVVIITLDRYEHFKRCIESLEKNPWAKYTEVYVSVDYPPEQKYREGNSKIIEYLESREFSAFKMLHLYFQKENLGMAENADFIRKEAYRKFDRVIYFEDDLEVSPNYLEFMNKALEAGCNDERMYGACAFSDKMDMPRGMSGTVFKALGCSYGCGIYRVKREQMLKEISVEWLDSIVYDMKAMYKIFLRSKATFHLLLNGYIIRRQMVFFYKDGSLRPIDIVMDVYMIMHNMYVMLPTVSKVRNWGMDGSGQNCGNQLNMRPENQEFDLEESFTLKLENSAFMNRIITRRWSWRIKNITGEGRWVLYKEWIYYCYLLFRRKYRCYCDK